MSTVLTGATLSQQPLLFLDISLFSFSLLFYLDVSFLDISLLFSLLVSFTLIADRVSCRDLSPIDCRCHGWLVHDPVQTFFTTFYQLVS